MENFTSKLENKLTGGVPGGMKGLKNFIYDIRECKSKEGEKARVNKELANIRKNFKGEGKSILKTDKQLDGYQKKKYVSKLVYIYLLGYPVDFGYIEAVSLISSSKYSEKHVGYLFVSVVLNEEHELIRLLVQSMKKDLIDYNETNVCLALNCIANVGGPEVAESLGDDVYRLLTASDSNAFVKKKAALALLRLYRKYPQVLDVKQWSGQIIALLNERDLGVLTSSLTLVHALAADEYDTYEPCVAVAIHRLKNIIMEREDLNGYVYYKVPAPWIQVKILRLIQTYPPPTDAAVKEELRFCLDRILAKNDLVKIVQTNNCRQSVLFEAMNTVIHLQTEAKLTEMAVDILGRYMTVRETNTRYMALDIMCNLCSLEIAKKGIIKHQPNIIQALKFERDISVRRRALDLLFKMCGPENAVTIITALVGFLEHAEYIIREEMVLRIAILAETEARDYSFYVDVILNLTRVAGDYVSLEVWQRVIQIITNRQDVQEYACRVCFQALSSPPVHETMVKVGSYLLGEFGHLIANTPASSPWNQFETLKTLYLTVSPEAKAILLSTFAKYMNLFPELKPTITQLFKSDLISKNHNPELQQRAIEYLMLGTIVNEDLLQAVLEEMPPYPERDSTILAKLHAKENFVTDKTWGQSKGRNAAKSTALTVTDANDSAVTTNNNQPQSQNAPQVDLLNMDDPTVPVAPGGIVLGFDGPAPTAPSAGSEPYLKSVVMATGSILFEDSRIRIMVKDEYKTSQGRLALYYFNKTSSTFVNTRTRVHSEAPESSGLSVEAKPCPPVVAPGQQVFQVFQFQCTNIYMKPPLMTLLFEANGAPQSLVIRLPVYIAQFLNPFSMDKAQFGSRWQALGGPQLEAQVVFSPTAGLTPAMCKQQLSTLKLTVLDGVDPNNDNIVAAGVIMSTVGQVGVLVRLEPNAQTQKWRLTCRGSKPLFAGSLAVVLHSFL
ncbi:hypothetical protein SARC_08642 [Sphaeroforma arctica JP610]|uniref:AP-2 complex subunit alpha n=1 Tax=Sphaeroforma arctica JP610 TaxID=667725 RepID=A0A0L0FQG7_9EUKA|nr:hypothetical protein SARC_08642 [Sphaeroforma arctica JP610]KNC78944.1 hypothetical protein SARC_08642 [Sphaeroforma arctica JP610]|eukprot:XP_014152846.1 hypothetical protein SARC_08642 [Sphaeroforma arctica JP610]